MTGISLHLGAHRTGSTAFQRTLKRNAAALAGDGIAYWGPEWLRAREYFLLRDRGVFDAGAHEAVAADLAATGAKRLVISEENMLGSMRRNLLKGRFYPNAAVRLTAYAGLIGKDPDRIGLGIRDYAAYWASVYAYLLPAKPLPDFAELKPGLLFNRRGWREVVADIRAVFPRAEILVWPLEAVQGRLSRVVARVAGCAPERLTEVARGINAAPGPAAIPVIQSIKAANPGITGPEMRARLAGIDLPKTGGPELFSGPDRLEFAARYGEDLAALEAGAEGVTFIAGGTG